MVLCPCGVCAAVATGGVGPEGAGLCKVLPHCRGVPVPQSLSTQLPQPNNGHGHTGHLQLEDPVLPLTQRPQSRSCTLPPEGMGIDASLVFILPREPEFYPDSKNRGREDSEVGLEV